MTDEAKPDQELEVQQRSDWETIKAISERIEQARAAGKFMICVFHVDEESKLTLNRSCHDFPVVDFENAVNLLKTDLEKERAGAQVATREQMPEAAPLPPVIDLFGKPPGERES